MYSYVQINIKYFFKLFGVIYYLRDEKYGNIKK